jgi:NAD(P)-dependent dehydrogenase (short-subunit alcohol dehydrogenase family)
VNLDGATALVTGANRGFGRHVAAELLQRGATVYAGARDPASVELPGARPVQLDITDPDSIAAAVAAAGDVSLLVNNAGSNTWARLLDGQMSDIRLELETHLFGTLEVIRAVAPGMAARGGGAILNVLSALSWFASTSFSAYSVAKSAEWGMTNALRLELADANVVVSALHVGFMDTDMIQAIDAPKSDPAHIARIAIDGVQDGDYEIVADETSRRVLAGLSGGVAALYPQLR